MTANMPTDWPNSEYSTVVETPDLRWHVQIARAEEGSSSPPTVLLLHGTGGSTHEWAHILAALRRYATVIAPDLPGHGFSTVSGHSGSTDQLFSLPGMAAALAALLRTLDVVPAVLAGHSAGAAVALRLALDGHSAPRHIVGFNPALVPPPDLWVDLLAPFAGVVLESSWVARSAAWTSRRPGVVRSMLESSGAQVTAEQLGRYQTLFAEPAHCAAALAMMSRWNLPALVRDAAGLEVAFTAYAGARDQWVPARDLAAQVSRIPGATLVEVPDVGHLMPEESPATCIEAIQRVLG